MLSACLMLLDTSEDKKKFKDIYEREHKELLKYAMSKLPAEAAEDAVSEGFLRLAEKFQKYSHLSCSDFHKLLVTIIRNIIIDIYRKDGRNVSEEYYGEDDSAFMEESVRLYEQYGGPEKHTIDNERMAEMLAEIDKLSPVLRETFLLRHYVGLSIADIAKREGITVRSAESRLYRATQQIRKGVNADEQ